MHQTRYIGCMSTPDLNLLITLEALLAEGSVARAARRLRLSPSAMSRQLARLRDTIGDPLLVRAGRGLVPTPRGLELRDRVGPLVREAEAALRPGEGLDLSVLSRTFTLRSREGFAETFGPALIERVAAEAPHARLRFAAKPDRDSGPLRDGEVDLETGVVGAMTGPEVRAQALFRDRLVAVASAGHPLARGRLTPERYAAARHVAVTRGVADSVDVDEALGRLDLKRNVVVAVESFSAATALARSAGLVATLPERHTAGLRDGLDTLPLPFDAPRMTLSLLWHPRMDADPAHCWLRRLVREVCAA